MLALESGVEVCRGTVGQYVAGTTAGALDKLGCGEGKGVSDAHEGVHCFCR
jgi:hypothetical protein